MQDLYSDFDMKPKTDEQKKVWGMSLRLLRQPMGKGKKLYLTYTAWRGLYCDHYKAHVRCLHCGSMVKMDPKKAKGQTCPECGCTFTNDIYLPSGKKVDLWLLSAEVHFGYQVFRKYVVYKYFSKQGMTIEVTEVNQNWIREDGKITTVSRSLNYMNWNQTYSLYSDFAVRGNYGNHNDWYYDVLPGHKHISRIYGPMWNGKLCGRCHMSIIQYTAAILKSRYAETIMKILGGDALVSYMTSQVPEHCWRLALRYLWHTDNWSDWEDHIRNLQYLGMDTHNPKMVVPEDFDAEHTRINIIVNRKRAKEEEKRRRENEIRRAIKAEQDRKEYINRLKELLPLEFKDENLTFTVIQSPADMVIEGSEMQHCVGGYYNKEDSLIMSCRDEKRKRIETIEVSLKDYKVLQSRGKCNIHTKWHDRILKAMDDNMGEIRRLDKIRRKRLRRKVREAV